MSVSLASNFGVDRTYGWWRDMVGGYKSGKALLEFGESNWMLSKAWDGLCRIVVVLGRGFTVAGRRSNIFWMRHQNTEGSSIENAWQSQTSTLVSKQADSFPKVPQLPKRQQLPVNLTTPTTQQFLTSRKRKKWPKLQRKFSRVCCQN